MVRENQDTYKITILTKLCKENKINYDLTTATKADCFSKYASKS
jgi:hypothetical protein